MNADCMQRMFGREAFGVDPAGYDEARPAYPSWVFDFLCERCGLGPETTTFEIGAGTGTATRELLKLGANPLIAIEPDGRLSAFLREAIPDEALTIITKPFEETQLRESTFDLGVCATAFHWLDEDLALAKIAELLRAGGWWAMFWNVFGDPGLHDPFHESTKSLLGAPLSPSVGKEGVPFALDTEARLAALERTGKFDSIDHGASKWTLHLDPEQTAALYATFSNVIIRPDRGRILNALRRIARDEFKGHVTRQMITAVYIARRVP